METAYQDIKKLADKFATVILFLWIGVVLMLLIPYYKVYVAYQFSVYLILNLYGVDWLTIYHLYWMIVLSLNIFLRWSGLALLFGSIAVNYFFVQSLISF